MKTRKRYKISAIIPVYNEEKTIGSVIATLLQNDSIDEVICINDGSTDNSLKILKTFGDTIKLTSLDKNYGKGRALSEGIKAADGEIVVFFDGDLINLNNTYINELITPILSGKYKAVLGYPSDGWLDAAFVNLTGQRAYFKKDLLPHLNEIAKTRFGVETFLNSLFKQEKYILIRPLNGLKALNKYEKHGLKNSSIECFAEAIEISLAIGKREGLIPKDYKIISQLVKAANMEEVRKKIKNISNKNIREFLELYIVKNVKKLPKMLQ